MTVPRIAHARPTRCRCRVCTALRIARVIAWTGAAVVGVVVAWAAIVIVAVSL